MRAGAIGERLLRAPTIVAWDLNAVCPYSADRGRSEMPGLGLGQMKLPLQIGSNNVNVAHRHLGINVPQKLHERRQSYACAYHLTRVCVW